MISVALFSLLVSSITPTGHEPRVSHPSATLLSAAASGTPCARCRLIPVLSQESPPPLIDAPPTTTPNAGGNTPLLETPPPAQ